MSKCLNCTLCVHIEHSFIAEGRVEMKKEIFVNALLHQWEDDVTITVDSHGLLHQPTFSLNYNLIVHVFVWDLILFNASDLLPFTGDSGEHLSTTTCLLEAHRCLHLRTMNNGSRVARAPKIKVPGDRSVVDAIYLLKSQLLWDWVRK